jgi:polysaccharide biosynthesis/export protein
MLLRTISCLILVAILANGLDADENNSIGPEAADISAASQLDYVLQPFDLVQVVVFQEPDMERKTRLSEESSLTLPLIGTINLAGKTVRQAQDIVTDLYNRDYLVNPQVNITVLEYSKVTVNVLGAVNTPGSIVIPPGQPLKLLDAVTRAGGFSRLADRKRVKLTRITHDGKTSTSSINADDIIQSSSDDPWILQKGDVIYVPERIL